jgi:hypothetical protein
LWFGFFSHHSGGRIMSEHNETHSLPLPLRDLMDRELEPDENLHWVGQPGMTFFLGISAFAPCLFAIPWTGFAVFWMYSAARTGAPLFFVLFGLPFVLVGLAMLGSPLFTRRSLKNTVYAITDRRAIIIVKSFFSTKVVSVGPDELAGLQRKERANGTGDILFNGSDFTSQQAPGTIPTNGFHSIPEVREVERLLKSIAAQATKDEETDAQEPQPFHQLDDLPILHYLDSVPRDLSLSVRLYLRMCSTVMPLFGWFFAGFGLAFALFAIASSGPEDIEQNWDGVLIFIAFGSLFGIIGLCFPAYSWFTGGKAIRLLQYGTAIQARHLATSPTSMTVNDKPVMKVDFEYLVGSETYTASARALDVSRLTNAKCKVVIYDPMQPGRSIVLDGLPHGIQFDEWTGRFRVNPLCCVLPLLAATIVFGEIIAIIVLAILAN